MAETDPVKYFKSEIKRLNYYNSQFLKEDDFRDEQLYHKQMRYLHHRALHTWGIVEGLVVKPVAGANKVTVTSGIAIDRLGHEIVLPAETDAITLDAFAANSRVYITIKYGEVFDQADKDTQSTSKLYTRTTERPEVNATATAPTADAPEVVLAVVVLDKDKAIAQIDTAARRYSGSRFGSSADGKEFSIYADSAGVWHFADAGKGADRLTVDDKGTLKIGGGDLQLDTGREIFFKENGQIRSIDDNHRILFRRSENKMEMREFGDIIFSPGANAGAETAKVVMLSNGNVGIGRSTVGAKLDVNGEVRSLALRLADSEGNPFPDSGVWMANNIDGATKWLHIGGITDTGERRLTLQASLINMSGSVGIGTVKPRTALDTGKGVMSGAANDYIKAQFTMSGGGTVTWGGVGARLKWSNRFIAISMAKSTAIPNGHINIIMPKTDIPAAQVYDGKVRSVNADGVVLNGWEALYAVHNVGGVENDVSFMIVKYDNDFNAPSNWILVAVVNDDDKSIKLGTGVIVSARSSTAKGNGVPCGAIFMWSGTSDTIPDGWALCDGSSGTPDLTDRFIVGAGRSYVVASKGGAASVTLTVGQLPAHFHEALGSGKDDGNFSGGNIWNNTPNGERIPFTHSDSATATEERTRGTGGGQAHENRPPYYALCYIMKVF
jgi:microcystin-dependent protein